ncbi:MAG: hypothetical protein AAB434_05395 [Planctomycetota bacterium]
MAPIPLRRLAVLLVALPLGICTFGEEPPAERSLPDGARLRLGSTRFRHTWEISSIAVSPDGSLIAAVAQDGSVRIWDSAGKSIATRDRGRAIGSGCIAFSQDGSRVAVATGGALHVLDASTAEAVVQLAEMNWFTGEVRFLPGGDRIVSFDSNRIRVWDPDVGATPCQEATLEAGVSRTLSPDGKRAFVGSSDGEVSLWDVAGGVSTSTIAAHRGDVTALAVSPKGMTLVSAGTDGWIREWDVDSGKALTAFHAHDGGVLRVVVSPDGRRVASLGKDGGIRVWDFGSGDLMAEAPVGLAPTQDMEFFQDSSRLAVARGNTVRIWDLAGPALAPAEDGHEGAVRDAALLPDGKVLATASDDGTVRVWDLSSGREVRRLDAHPGGVTAVAASPDGTGLATAGMDNRLRVWSDSGEPVEMQDPRMRRPCDIAFSPDGTRLASASDDASLRLWDARTGALTGTVGKCHHQSGWVVFLREGESLASNDVTDGVQMWDLEGRKLGGLVDRAIRHPAFSPDGDWLVGSYGHGLALFEGLTGTELMNLEGDGYLDFPDFSPDGHHMVASIDHRRIAVWDLDSGKLSNRLTGNEGHITWLSFSRDGASVLSAGAEGTVLVWNAGGPREGEKPLSNLEGAWAALRELDATQAFAAEGTLLLHPEETVRLLDERLQAPPPLDPSAPTHALLPAGETLRWVRAVEVLERLGTSEALGVLRRISEGPDGTREVLDARRALERAAREGDAEVEEAAARADLLGDPLPRDAAARIGTQRFHCGKPIDALAVSQDGKFVATLSGRSELTLWDSASGRALARWSVFSADVLAVSRDSRLVATGNHDGDVAIFSQDHLEDHSAFVDFVEPVALLAFSADDKSVACVTSAGEVIVRDIASREELGRAGPFDPKVTCLVQSSVDSTWAIGAQDGSLRLWKPGVGAEVPVITTDAGPVLAIAFASDGARVTTGGIRGVKVWEVAGGRELESLGLPDEAGANATAVALSRDGSRAFLRGTKGRSLCWDLARRRVVEQLEDPRNENGLSVDGEGAIAAWAEGGIVRVWRPGETFEAAPASPTDGVLSIAFSPDGSVVATGEMNGAIRVWETRSGRPVLRLASRQRPVILIAFLPGGESVLSVDSGGVVQECGLGTGKCTRSAEFDPPVGVALSSDGARLALGRDGAVDIVETSTLKSLERLTCRGSASGLAFSPDGATLLIGAKGPVVALDPGSGKTLFSLPHPGAPVLAMCVSPDGRRVFTACLDSGLRVHERASGGLARPAEVLSVGWGALAADPRGRWVAAGDDRRRVRVLDGLTGEVVEVFDGHLGDVMSLAFSQDGRWLVSGGEDATALVWDMARVNSGQGGLEGIDASWARLGDADAKTALRAWERLASRPAQVGAFLRERLLAPVPRTEGVDDQGTPKAAKQLAPCELRAGETLRRMRAVRGLDELGGTEAVSTLEAVAREAGDTLWGREAAYRLGRRGSR